MHMEMTIWEEKNLIEPPKKLENSGETVPLDITTLINRKFAINEWKDITNQKISGIYKIKNKTNGKYYIGSSKDILGSQGRFNNHKWRLIGNRHDNIHLQRAWNKYGPDAFEFQICEISNPDNLFIKEQEYLDMAKLNINMCYNLSFIADRVDMTTEIKNKLSIAHTGKKFSQKHIDNMKRAFTSVQCKQSRQKNMRGNKNPNYNSTIFNFKNINLNITFKGTVTDLCEQYSILGNKKTNVFAMTRGKQKSAYGWIVIL